MRYGIDDTFWVVTDPRGTTDTLGDICFETSLRGLSQQFAGGLKLTSNPALFTSRGEAELEAEARLLAVRAAKEIERRLVEAEASPVASIVKVYDDEGNELLSAKL